MANIAIVYWSGTGNTEAMADMVKQGVEGAGGSASVLDCASFGAASLDEYDAVIFGCPAMGDEELEADEFEPMFSDCESALAGRTVALFGSYEWNTGEWMDTWRARTEADGAKVVGAVIACGYPDADAEAACSALGADVVSALG